MDFLSSTVGNEWYLKLLHHPALIKMIPCCSLGKKKIPATLMAKNPTIQNQKSCAQSHEWKSRKSSPNKSCALAPPDLLSRASPGCNLEAAKWKWNCCRNCSGWFNRWKSPSAHAVSARSGAETWGQMDGPSVNSGQRKSQRWKSFGWGENVYWAILKYFTNSFHFSLYQW